MKIAMVLNKPSRELPIMQRIEQWVHRLAPETQVRIVEFHSPHFLHELLDFAPDIVFTFPFTALTTSIPIYLLKFVFNCRVLCFRTEGVINFDFERQVMGNVGLERYGANLVDYELFWGERFAAAVGERLLENGKISSLERVRTFGYPPYEVYFNGTSPKAELPAEALTLIARFPRDRVVFFISGFPLADYTPQDIINSGDCLDPNGDNRDAELAIALDGVKRSQYFRKLWIAEITDLAAAHPELLVIVKSHPIEQEIARDTGVDPYAVFGSYDNILYIHSTIPISDIIPYSGLFVHYGSTAVGETYLARVPSIFVSIDEAYQGKVNATNAMYYHNDLGWPSTRKTEIAGLRPLIEEHLADSLSSEFSREMRKILKEQFNIDDAQLAGEKEYLPSRDIARFLLWLAQQPAQPIAPDDPYLGHALKAVGVPAAQSLCDHGIARFNVGDFAGARAGFASAKRVAHLMGLEIPHVDEICSQAETQAAVGQEGAVPGFEARLAQEQERSAQTEPPAPSEPPPPRIFMVETTLACDLRCPECAIGGKLIHRKPGIMSLERFRIVADKIRPYCQYLFLHIWGEPMLNPDIIEMIRYASSFTRTNISTNGMSLTEELAEALITSGLSALLVSIDGLSQEVYGRYRVGGSVQKALASLELLQRLNQKHGSPVTITPQFVVFKHNQHEMGAFQEHCRSLGLEASFKAPYLRAGSQFENSDYPDYIRTSYPDVASLRAAMSQCLDPREVFTILQDGSSVPCCYDHDGTTSFGNIFENEVMEIWQSPRYREFRHRLLTGDAPQFCLDNCLSYLAVRPTPVGAPQADLTPSRVGRDCRRQRQSFSSRAPEELLTLAREAHAEGRFEESFDLYEGLAALCPSQSVALLSEAYARYLALPDHDTRYSLYVSRYFDFGIQPGDKVLDIGSGHLPFPFATHLADLALEDGGVGRAGAPFRYLDGKPVYECSVEKMPFADQEFDFINCSHVLEHVSDPEQACAELARVGKRGYIETPTKGKDQWLNTGAPSNHRWWLDKRGDTLIFTEYTEKELQGFECDVLLDMHCNPQTDRERAFSALLYLKADQVNLMHYWEGKIRCEVRRRPAQAGAAPATGVLPSPPRSTPAPQAARHSALFVNTYYENFLDSFYRAAPAAAGLPYREQQAALQAEFFGDSDFYSLGLAKAGWDAEDLIVNAEPLQAAWCREQGVHESGIALAVEQIRRARPDVVYLQNLGLGMSGFLEAIRPHVGLIAGQIAYPLPQGTDLPGFDLIFSSFPHFVNRFRAAGITAYYQPLAFDPRVLESLTRFPYDRRPIDCSFVGGISTAHGKGYQLLETLATQVPIEFWGYGADTLPPDSAIRPRHHGEVWGREMFYLLGASRITVNRHIDVAENAANNMRLFEATGCGALLITDYKENLGQLFEIGREVVVYRSPEECIERITYYLAHPEEAAQIARAGQERTLRDHSYDKSMKRTAGILERHLRYRAEAGTLGFPSSVSDGYRSIDPAQVTPSLESAWQDPVIPPQQRALVQQQLAEMYRGQVPQPFQVLAELLAPVARESRSVLEVGCASGYYSEVLEYLLMQEIDYTGVDYSPAMIELACSYYPQARFIAADGAQLPLADRSFPLVISGCVLLHTPRYPEHVAETARVAGRWIALHRTPVHRSSATSCSSKLAYGVETVEFRFNEQELLGLFEEQGFRPTRILTYSENPASDAYEVSYLLERVPQPARTLAPPDRPARGGSAKPAAARKRPVVLVSRAIAFTFPLSYAYLAGELRARGEQVTVLFKDVPPQELIRQIMELDPLVVGFGNLYPELAETAGLIRMLNDAGRSFPVVIGGQMVSPTPEFALRITGADFGIIGEGELILAELVRRLRDGTDASDLPGVVIRRGSEIVNNGQGAYIEDLSSGLPAIPYDLFPTDQWLPIGEWYARNLPVPHWKREDRVINVHGGRGCPYTCNFCYHHSKARYREIPVMMAEAQEALRRFDGNMLYFSDDLVMASPLRARQLVEAIGALDRPVSFQISTRFDILSRMDDQLLGDLKRVGCRSMGLGLESGSDRILQLIGKNCTVEQIEDGLERLRVVGIYPTTSIMVGQHTETVEDAAASLALMERTLKSNPYLNYAFTLATPFPGSKLYKLIFEQGLLKDDLDFYNRYFSSAGEFKQVVNLSAMTDNEVNAALYRISHSYDILKREANAAIGFG